MQKESIIKRLSFIKYLVGNANSQSKLAEPMNASSLLSYHDAVELFLDLVSVSLEIPLSKSFMGYWNTINLKLKEKEISELTQKETMNKLNKARVGLKHYGNLPSKLNIDEFRIIVNTFFIENSKNIFDIEFKDVSMIDLIPYEKTKKSLQKALSSFKEKNYSECVKNLAISFEYLIREYEQSKTSKYGVSPFFFGRDMSFLSSFHMGYDSRDKMAEFIDNVKDSVEAMQKAVKVLSMGIDYRKYVRFSMITPKPYRILASNEPQASVEEDITISSEEFDYCFTFIIESALKLNEFDFNIKEEDTTSKISKFF